MVPSTDLDVNQNKDKNKYYLILARNISKVNFANRNTSNMKMLEAKQARQRNKPGKEVWCRRPEDRNYKM